MSGPTLEAWLAAREPAPPPALAARLRELLGADALGAREADATECLLAAGEATLARLLREAKTTRESALDLLAADALVTYAFEAAGEQAATLETRAASAMVRIAHVPADVSASGTGRA